MNTEKCKNKNKKMQKNLCLGTQKGQNLNHWINFIITDHKSNVESFMFQEVLGFANKQVCYKSHIYCSLAQKTYDMLSSKEMR